MSSMRRGNMKHMSSKMRAEARVVSCHIIVHSCIVILVFWGISIGLTL